MNLNKNSFSARLYRWFYNQNSMPTNLCPYFWKLVTAYIFSLPLVIIILPFELIYGKFGKHNEDVETRFGISVLLWIIGFILFTLSTPLCYLLGINPEPDSRLMMLVKGSVLMWSGLVLFGLFKLFAYLIALIRDGYRGKKSGSILKETKPNIVVEFIKAKYNKYCPKITWGNES